VAASDGHLPDWRDSAAYEPLLDAERSFFAWEWLRRNPGYRAAAERISPRRGTFRETQAAPGRWGLHSFVPPDVTVPEARPVWRAEIHPFVLCVDAHPANGEDQFDLGRFAAVSTLLPAVDGREHLLISDGFRSIRIDVMAGSLLGGPAELRYRLAGFKSAERPLLTLRRLLAIWQTGRFSRSLHPKEVRAKRWVLMLRALDALAADADQREIAAVLFSEEARQPRWRVHSPSVRSRTQRLVRSARVMAAGGFRALLSSSTVSVDAGAASPFADDPQL
jgi:hypothetical protein